MIVTIERFFNKPNVTIGSLSIDKKFYCFTLEDGHREEKVKGETRIAQGTYSLALRKEGGFHKRYQKRFPDIHQGMIHVQNVPDFEWILIHCGNSPQDTAGCLLVGLACDIKKQSIGRSRDAYRLIYPPIRDALQAGTNVSIIYRNERT